MIITPPVIHDQKASDGGLCPFMLRVTVYCVVVVGALIGWRE